jgi:hypothetical protein
MGEAKWDEVMSPRHVQRLARAAELLAARGYNTSASVLACYGGAGFAPELTAMAATEQRIILVDLAQLYG